MREYATLGKALNPFLIRFFPVPAQADVTEHYDA